MPWSVAAVGGIDSWAISGDGKGKADVDVYVIDSGVTNSDINVVQNIDFRPSSNNPKDTDGHGTHIGGIIAAIDDGDGLVGLAPGARVHNLKVLEDDGRTDVSIVIAAVEHVLSAKLQNPSKPMVVNMSLGENIGVKSYTALDQAIKVASEAGVVFIVAAGNSYINANTVTPAHSKEAITVGSYDINGVFSSFSNYGNDVDILAPGEGIISLSPSEGGGTPVTMSGTSMATAHVTGAAALYLAQNPSASVKEVYNGILNRGKSFVINTPAQTTKKSVWVGETGPNCNLEGSLKSMQGEQVPLVVRNESNDDLKIYWIDRNGARQDYGTISAGNSWSGTTYSQHPWLIARASDDVCQQIVLNPAEQQEVVISGEGNAPTMSTPKTVLTADSFESGLWWIQDGWRTNNARSGRSALEFGWRNNANASFSFDAQAGEQFTVEGWFQRNGSPEWTGFGIDFKDANGNEISEIVETVSKNNGFHKVSKKFTTPSGTKSIAVWFASSGTNGSLSIDDICVSRGNSCKDNLLPDAGFEGGIGFQDNAWIVNDAASGNQALETGWRSSAGYWKDIAIIPGKTYSVSSMVKKVNNPEWAGFGLDFWDGNGNKVSSVNKTVTANSYTNMSVAGTAPANAASVSVWFWSNGSNGSLKVDDVIVTEQ